MDVYFIKSKYFSFDPTVISNTKYNCKSKTIHSKNTLQYGLRRYRSLLRIKYNVSPKSGNLKIVYSNTKMTAAFRMYSNT